MIQRPLAFKSFIDGIDFSKYNFSNIIATAKAAAFMGQRSKMTIEQTGVPSIYVASTGYESARVTCILAILLDGTKVPPLVITKGKKEKIEQVLSIYILEMEKNLEYINCYKKMD